VAYRHAASFEVPKSWLQQGQQWRILTSLEQLVQTAPTGAADLRTAAAAARSRAADTQALDGRPFEHADQLVAALARQQQIEAAMRDQATAEAPEPAAQASQTIDSKRWRRRCGDDRRRSGAEARASAHFRESRTTRGSALC
jgi:hypothetical protein